MEEIMAKALKNKKFRTKGSIAQSALMRAAMLEWSRS